MHPIEGTKRATPRMTLMTLMMHMMHRHMRREAYGGTCYDGSHGGHGGCNSGHGFSVLSHCASRALGVPWLWETAAQIKPLKMSPAGGLGKLRRAWRAWQCRQCILHWHCIWQLRCQLIGDNVTCRDSKFFQVSKLAMAIRSKANFKTP